MSTDLPRIAMAGLAIESSAYAAHRADYRDFRILTGSDQLARYPFLAEGSALGEAAHWLPVFDARSIPGGPMLPEVYAHFRERILTGLRERLADGPLDGVYLDLHGAVSVVGMDDAEGDLVAAIRDLIGPEPLIGATMDLHGNISPRFFEHVDLPTCYRMAPHEDAWETRERAAGTLLDQIGRSQRPVRAWVPVPILLPGEKTSTRVEPARSLYAQIPEQVQHPGVVDASIWIGYAWADEPRCHASVVATGTDRDAVASAAESLAGRLWHQREEFDFVGPPGTLAEGVAAALAATQKPYFISDSGDNPGAGGTGDVTWTLTELLGMAELTGPDAPLTYVASIFDAEAIEALATAQIGAHVQVTAGARVDHRVSGPVTISGTLTHLSAGDPDAGRIAVIAVGGLRVILTEFRKAFHATADFEAIGLPVAEADIVVTKIGYLEPTLYEAARGWTLALTPGPVDQNIARLGQVRIQRPMFPYDPFPTPPALKAQVR